ncbi:MAG TPA: twin-arginine translocation signal domain-containing protein [Casimicrobiaceae bacterium]|nr:twin-arginine translocation signal domain-containing protein [Casimicrobiaceae bacterium]
MERRRFLSGCAMLGGGAAVAPLSPWPAAWAQSTPRTYARTRLVDIHGRPIRLASLEPEINYVFQYPYAATPCLLVKLRTAVTAPASLRRNDGSTYAWGGGVGQERNTVAFSAICAHKLAYPTREVSFIRYQRDPSPTSGAHVIHCCADHSVYDPSQGARVVSGPAPQPLAAIVLDYDAGDDGLYALGTVGAEQFDAFFDKYRIKLSLEYGERARNAVGETTVVRELTSYCRTTIQC